MVSKQELFLQVSLLILGHDSLLLHTQRLLQLYHTFSLLYNLPMEVVLLLRESVILHLQILHDEYVSKLEEKMIVAQLIQQKLLVGLLLILV